MWDQKSNKEIKRKRSKKGIFYLNPINKRRYYLQIKNRIDEKIIMIKIIKIHLENLTGISKIKDFRTLKEIKMTNHLA